MVEAIAILSHCRPPSPAWTQRRQRQQRPVGGGAAAARAGAALAGAADSAPGPALRRHALLSAHQQPVEVERRCLEWRELDRPLELAAAAEHAALVDDVTRAARQRRLDPHDARLGPLDGAHRAVAAADLRRVRHAVEEDRVRRALANRAHRALAQRPARGVLVRRDDLDAGEHPPDGPRRAHRLQQRLERVARERASSGVQLPVSSQPPATDARGETAGSARLLCGRARCASAATASDENLVVRVQSQLLPHRFAGSMRRTAVWILRVAASPSGGRRSAWRTADRIRARARLKTVFMSRATHGDAQVRVNCRRT